MGRNKKTHGRRDHQVKIRLTAEEQQKMLQAAEKIGYPLAQFVRIAAYKAASAMLTK